MPADGGTRADSDGKLHVGRVLAPIRALVIEIFSGTKRFSVAVSQYAQLQVASWDILEGPEYDLLKWPTVRRLLRLLESPYVIATWWGTPCTTMTVARRAGRPGPPPVRSLSHPEGLPGLSESLQKSVADGNHFAQVTAVGIEVGHRSGSVCIVENPWRSFLWRISRLQQAFEFIGATEILFDF